MYISSSKASILILYLTAGGLTGLGFSLMMLPSFDILTYYFTKNLGLATGLGTMGSPVGQMILGPLLNYTITTLGPGTSLCCLSGLMLLGVGSGLCFTIPCKKKTQTQKRQESSSHQTKDAIKTLLSSPKIYILCFRQFFFAFGLFTTYSYLSSRAIYFGINEDMNGVLLAIIGVTTCVGRVIFGIILDKYRPFSIQITSAALAINSIFVMTSSF